MFAPLAALIGGIVALCNGEAKGPAVAALVIALGTWGVLFLLPALCM